MKKEICNVENLIISENDTKKIDKEKIDAIEINGKKIFKRNGNDINKYIFSFENSKKYLEEFPEYLDGYIPFATNTGLMCFYKGLTLVVYDLTEEEKDINLNSITPDTSFFADYNYISTPLNIRKINYEGTNFIADKSFTYNGNIYSFFNCDKIKDVVADNTGYFKTSSSVNTISYEFKPIISIRAFTNNGEKNTSLKIKINNKDMIHKNNDNIYYYDCSNFIENKAKYLLKLLNENEPSVNQLKLIIKRNISVNNNYKLQVQPKNIETILDANFPDLVLSLANDKESSGYLEVM